MKRDNTERLPRGALLPEHLQGKVTSQDRARAAGDLLAASDLDLFALAKRCGFSPRAIEAVREEADADREARG